MADIVEEKTDETVEAAQAAETNGDQKQAETEYTPDDDPMLAGLKEAEAEIAAEEAAQKKTETAQDTDQDQKEAPAAAVEEKPTGAEKETPMIPKPRFDEVRSERDKARDQVAYLQGIVHTQKEMLSGAAAKAGATAGQDEGKKAEDAAPEPKVLIEQAENKKIELAEKYENGEISLVELEKERVALDRQIRELDEKRTQTIVEEAKRTATQTVAAAQTMNMLEQQAVQTQQNHPYIAEIDKLPPAESELRWNQITSEAVLNLAKKGIDAADGSIQSRIALINEKAALTDVYGPIWTGKQIAKSNDGQKSSGKAQEIAQQRAAKLDLSQQIPPDVTGMRVGPAFKDDLTEHDLETMSDDQLADALSRNPSAVHKAAGFATR